MDDGSVAARTRHRREVSTPEERLHDWQLRLLPVIVRILLGVTIFFFVVSLAQLAYLHWRIELGTAVDVSQQLRSLEDIKDSPAERREAVGLAVKAVLEASALDRRYKQARVLLMARVWTSYLGFVTGMALSMVGAAFILGRIQGVASTAKVEWGQAKAELASSTPGLFLVLFGVALMISTIVVHHDINVGDAAVYLRDAQPSSSAATGASAPELTWPAAYPRPPSKKE